MKRMNRDRDAPPRSWLEWVREKAERKQRARREPENIFLYGLGTFGLVGWSIAIPTLMGIGIGLWIDKNVPSQYSWTLTLLFGGVILGCLNAWYWIQRQREED
ncbi:MAG: AtpZ/AtpI family protein [Cyanobacteria bacterium J06641_5]